MRTIFDRTKIKSAIEEHTYVRLIGRIAFESLPDKLKEGILGIVDEEIFIFASGTVISQIIPMETFLASVKNNDSMDVFKETGEKLDPVESHELAYSVSVIANTVKESGNTAFMESATAGQDKSNEELELDLKGPIPEEIKELFDKDVFSNITKMITAEIIKDLKEEKEASEKDKEEEEKVKTTIDEGGDYEEEDGEEDTDGGEENDEKEDSKKALFSVDDFKDDEDVTIVKTKKDKKDEDDDSEDDEDATYAEAFTGFKSVTRNRRLELQGVNNSHIDKCDAIYVQQIKKMVNEGYASN